MFTNVHAMKVLCAAIEDDILILTVKQELAVEIYNGMMDYIACRRLKSIVSYYGSGYICFRGGYGNITVMSAERWNAEAKYDFNGRVYVTNRAVTDIKHIVNAPLPFTAILEEKV